VIVERRRGGGRRGLKNWEEWGGGGGAGTIIEGILQSKNLLPAVTRMRQ